ncbi:L-ascorbate oxidase homolog [Capsicum annuum]|uniref:L-ascorbate oxidase homolog n=1 Tax=Capsicum annuum TaxID=4072 RepID=UPI001FB19C8F|nr:L-ascorbate oxidase homolog [Capsicum annuum]
MESEFIAMSSAGEEANWLRSMLIDIPLWGKPIPPLTIYCDNKAAIFLSSSDCYNGKSRQVCLKHNHMRILLEDGIISLQYVKSKLNLADPLSKGLDRELMGILINGQFPGPTLNVVTNDNVIVTVINKLDDPLLITWNGVKQRKSSWQDGVVGTNCPIPPNSQWTYKMQMKVQIGTFTYFPSTLMHRAADGFGGINILARSVIPIPYPKPFEQFTLLVSDWWKTDNKVLQQILDQGQDFPFPDALHINGRPNSLKFTGMKGYAYLFRVSNVGLTASINVRIQGHTLKLVEVEGSHTMQEVYESLDIHVGQSMAFLVTLHANPKDNIVASTRFTKPILTVTAILHYQGSNIPASKPLPVGPTYQVQWSMKQARTIRYIYM